MTMHEEWTDKLSDYIDDELSNEERRAVTAHVAECAACARTLDELRTVVAAAHDAGPIEPGGDLWAGIAGRIASPEGARPVTSGPWRRFSFTLPQLAAASVVLALLSGLATMRFVSRNNPSATAYDNATGAAGAQNADLQLRQGVPADLTTAVSFDDTEYDAAVADLERALQDGRGRLDPTTIKVVEDNLSIIDQAVDDARHALVEDPANAYLSGYLVDTRRRKLDLLRQATALAEDLN